MVFPLVLALLGQSGKNLEETKKKVSTHREGLRRWTEDMGSNFFKWFFHWFWQFWAKVAKTSRTPKKKECEFDTFNLGVDTRVG